MPTMRSELISTVIKGYSWGIARTTFGARQRIETAGDKASSGIIKGHFEDSGRSRDDHRWSPPAQIRTSASTHTALMKDGWRRSELQDKGAGLSDADW
jgi:hypothetical protein